MKLQNASQVPAAVLEQIVAAAGWPRHRELLLFVGVNSLGPEDNGMAVWHGHRQQSPDFSGLWSWDGWDVAVLIAQRVTDLFPSHPTVVAWILGHELGHGLVAIADPDLHAAALCLQRVIRSASHGEVLDWRQIPLERACDQFGLHIAATMYSTERVRAEFEALARIRPQDFGSRLIDSLSDEPLHCIPELWQPMQHLAQEYAAAVSDCWLRLAADDPHSYCSIVDPSVLLGPNVTMDGHGAITEC